MISNVESLKREPPFVATATNGVKLCRTLCACTTSTALRHQIYDTGRGGQLKCRLILIYVVFLVTIIFRFCKKLCHLTYWLKWRFHSAIIGDSIPPLRWMEYFFSRDICRFSIIWVFQFKQTRKNAGRHFKANYAIKW